MAKEYPVNPIPHDVFTATDCVYLVGGGPSLRNFDWSKLEKKIVCTINKAMYVCPYAKLIYWADDRYWETHKTAILNHSAKYKVTAYSDLVRFIYPPNIRTYKFGRVRGFDDSVAGLCSGNNSGYSLINLVVKLGAKKLILLGYDFKYDEFGNSHWHEGHTYPDGTPLSHKEYTLTVKMLPNFESLRQPLQMKRVVVYNANKDSKLTIWPRITLDEAMSLASS